MGTTQLIYIHRYLLFFVNTILLHVWGSMKFGNIQKKKSSDHSITKNKNTINITFIVFHFVTIYNII